MDIRIRYQGVEGSPWMKQYMERQIERLDRYLSTGTVIFIELIHGPVSSCSNLRIQSHKKSFSFEGCGGDVFEAFTKTLEEACRLMKLEHKRQLSRFHQRLFFTEAVDE
ncbi:MAG: HPF/RaiA family ribosome-associated protein [Bdellovibrionota bacterium]